MIVKTPGAYVTEISVFPPSVAAVETAIPAFIGYTQKAQRKGVDDLRNVPTKIGSMLEYRELFGGAPPLNIQSVIIDANNKLIHADIQPRFFFFDSMQLFFQNGGGDCYIVSVGDYQNDVELGDRSDPAGSPGFDVGLGNLESFDEPTLILFPDAVLLNESDFHGIQVAALQQCAFLGDRFAILDLREKDDAGNADWGGQKDAFRNRIGIQNLKYGAAYTPHLRTSLKKDIKYRDISNIITRGGVSVSLASLTTEPEILQTIANLDALIADIGTIQTTISALINPSASLEQAFQKLVDELNAAATDDDKHAAFKRIIKFLYDMLVLYDDFVSTTPLTNPALLAFVNDQRSTALSALRRVIAIDRGAEAIYNGKYNAFTAYGPAPGNAKLASFNELTLTVNHASLPAAAAASEFGATGDPLSVRLGAGVGQLRNVLVRLSTVVQGILGEQAALEAQYNNTLTDTFPIYKNLIEDLNGTLSTLPPSGAIAGVYAAMDASRGVWRAPANVSLAPSVSGLTQRFKLTDTDGLNVDVNAGKSINAIVYQTGRGFIVWGARTLAGNDNEWRYINVRRFFNMVEESVKKAVVSYVFENNNINTWVKVKGLIDNFLILQWRAGALQGAKADDAYFVRIGLGETMTPLDVLEGRMIVEIGMAVVRPAEFIILKFMHKLPQA